MSDPKALYLVRKKINAYRLPPWAWSWAGRGTTRGGRPLRSPAQCGTPPSGPPRPDPVQSPRSISENWVGIPKVIWGVGGCLRKWAQKAKPAEIIIGGIFHFLGWGRGAHPCKKVHLSQMMLRHKIYTAMAYVSEALLPPGVWTTPFATCMLVSLRFWARHHLVIKSPH